jgi:hypothetical protein
MDRYAGRLGRVAMGRLGDRITVRTQLDRMHGYVPLTDRFADWSRGVGLVDLALCLGVAFVLANTVQSISVGLALLGVALFASLRRMILGPRRSSGLRAHKKV